MNATAMTRSEGWSTDVNRLCERLAERLAAEGAPHPGVGAVALAVRGAEGVDRAAFAEQLGLDEGELEAIEAGRVAYAELPGALRLMAALDDRLDLDRLLGDPG